MEKQRKIKYLSLIALIVAILGLTVAFAALSQTLTINGTASVNASEWDIHFESLGGSNEVSPELSRQIEEGEEIYGEPLIISEDKTSVKVRYLNLSRPGDNIKYKFKIVNNGGIDAKITDIIKNEGTYGTVLDDGIDWDSWDGEEIDWDIVGVKGTITDEQEEFIEKYFIYELTYTDTGEKVNVNDIIETGEEVNVTLTIGVDISAPEIPTYSELDEYGYNQKIGIAIAGLETKIIYSQK